MDSVSIGILGLIAMMVLIIARVWVGAALGIVGFAGLWILVGMDRALSVLGSAPFANINSYTLTVIPMFTLMGMIIAETDIGASLYRTAYSWIGHLKGGLASATVVACGMLGALTGGHYAAASIMAKIALPELRKMDYDDGFANASVAVGAPLAQIIPPSIAMIVYGVMTEQSVGALFMSGVIPGILQIILYIFVIYIMCTVNPLMGPAGKKHTFLERIRSLKGAAITIILFLAIFGSIYTGICTTTEAGAIGAWGALILAILSRDINGKKFYKCIQSTIITTGMILFLMVGTYVFTTFLAMSKIPFEITKFIIGLNVAPGVIIFAVILLYFVLGMFMPEIPMLVLTVPLLYPVLTTLGFDGIWLGLIVVKMVTIGSITPPVGMTVYILSGISKVPVTRIFKNVIPFLIVDAILLILFCIFPQIVTLLPSMMLK